MKIRKSELLNLIEKLFTKLIELSKLNADLLHMTSNPNIKENLYRDSLFRKIYCDRYWLGHTI